MKQENVTHLLATDLDGTLVGKKELTSSLFEYYEQLPYDVQLVYITGRHYDSAMELIQEERLPKPSVLISDVGTEMYDFQNEQLHEDWKAAIENVWNPNEIKAVVESCSGFIPQDIPSCHRLSFFVESSTPVEELNRKLNEHDIPCKVIFSSGKDVDILPANAGKGEALSFLLRNKGWEEANVLVAGDSGNDSDMITLGYPAVIVGNCQEELKKLPEHPLIFRAQKHCAGGIHEAWEHFFATSPVGR